MHIRYFWTVLILLYNLSVLSQNLNTRELLFSDDFSDGDISDWVFWKYSTGLHGPVQDPEVINGRAVIYTRDQQNTLLQHGDCAFFNYTLEYDARIEEGYDDHGNRIITNFYINDIHYVNNGQFTYNAYSFTVSERDSDWSLNRNYTQESGQSNVPLASGSINLSLNTDYDIKVKVVEDSVYAWCYEEGNPQPPLASVKVDPQHKLLSGSFGIGGSDDRISIDNVLVNGQLLSDPTIITSPEDVSGCEGGNISTCVVASGDFLAYQWYKEGIPVSGQSGACLSLNNLTPADTGSYTCEISGPCDTITTVPIVVSLDSIHIVDVIVTPSFCEDNQGSILIHANSGADTLYYSIDNGVSWQTDSLFTGLSQGDYYIAVTDSNACESYYFNNPVYIDYFAGPDIIQVNTSNENCGSSNGRIEIIASGYSPLEYSIDSGQVFQGDSIFENLGAGGYHIFVKDSNDCIKSFADNPVEILDEGGPEIQSIESENPLCGINNGSIAIMAEGEYPLTYSIDSGLSWQQDSLFFDLGSGSYHIMVTDANDCSLIYENNPVILTNLGGPQINSVDTEDPLCNQNNGTIEIIAEGTGPLSYSIDSGQFFQNDPVFTDQYAGAYYVLVKDSLGCLADYENNPLQLINQEGPEIIDVLFQNPQCNHNNGLIEITGQAAGGSLYYSIDDGISWHENQNLFDQLGVGQYNILLKDENECITAYEENPLVLQNEDGPQIDSVLTTTPSCDEDNGKITIHTLEPIYNLGFSINNGISWQDTNAFNNLGPGSYNIMVKDESDCEVFFGNNPIVLSNAGGVEILHVDVKDATCNESNGEISITGTVNYPGIHYSIDNGTSWHNSLNFSSLNPGFYNVQLKDSLGCLSSYANNPVEVVNAEMPEITQINSSDASCGQSNASINIQVNNNMNNSLQYSIDSGISWFTENFFENLAPGEYTLMIKDTNDCIISHMNNPLEINNLWNDHMIEIDVSIIASENPVHTGDSIIFTAIAENCDTNCVFHWMVNGIEKQVDKSNIYIAYQPIDKQVVSCLVISDHPCVINSSQFSNEIEIDILKEDIYLFVPNAFTPNGDGLNDKFGIITNEPLQDFKVMIYNRWGELVFESNRNSSSWDGRYKGKKCPVGSYAFIIYYEDKERTGTVTLIR